MYNAQDDINKLLQNKYKWHEADDKIKQNPPIPITGSGQIMSKTSIKAHKDALPQYSSLIQNGHGDLASYFNGHNYSQSKNYSDAYLDTGSKYNSNEIARKIQSLKNLYNDSENDKEKSDIAAKAQGYYTQLRQNGDDVMAGNLERSNSGEADKYLKNYYTLQGKTPLRNYLYSKGTQYGMSNDDVDKALSYNEQTGEVSLGGKNIGKYDVVDGVSYGNTENFDNVWNDYVKRTGKSLTADNLLKQGRESFYNQQKGTYNTAMNENPYTSAVGKSILDKYSLSGLVAGNNAAAKSAASNSGNIDSFSAANAMRQQASLLSQGQQAALDAHNAKISNANGLITTLGGYNKDLFNDMETAKNNDTDNYVKKSTADSQNKYTDMQTTALEGEVSGFVPQSLAKNYNPFFNSDGSVKDMDYKETMDGLISKLNDKDTSNDEKTDIRRTLRWASQAMAKKVSMPEYKQYASQLGDYIKYYSPEYTASEKDAERDAKTSLDITKSNNDTVTKQQQLINDGNATLQDKVNQGNVALQGKVNEGNATLQDKVNQGNISLQDKVNNGNISLQDKVNSGSVELANINNAADEKQTAMAVAAQEASASGSKAISDEDVKSYVDWINSNYPGLIEEKNGKYNATDKEALSTMIDESEDIFGTGNITAKKKYLKRKFNLY